MLFYTAFHVLSDTARPKQRMSCNLALDKLGAFRPKFAVGEEVTIIKDNRFTYDNGMVTVVFKNDEYNVTVNRGGKDVVEKYKGRDLRAVDKYGLPVE